MNKNSISYNLVLITCLIFGSYYFIDSFKFMMPYGYDEVLTVWPIGRALAESSFSEFPKILISSFFSEDHLFPINGIVSFFLYSKESDPLLTLSWATKILYLVIVILTIVLVNNLWKNKLNNIIALIFMIFSQSLFFGNLGYNINFNLVTIIALLTIILFLKYIELRSKKILYMFFGLCIIGTLTFENYFIIYPIILGLTLILMYDKRVVYYNSLNMMKIFLLFLLTLLPYMTIHYLLRGSLLPSSRLGIIESGNLLKNLLTAGFLFFNDLFFNIPKFVIQTKEYSIYFLLPLVFIFVISLYYFRKRILLTKYGYAFLGAFVMSLPFIMYTGRYHPGLWTILGIVGLIVFVDIFSNFIKKMKFTEFQTNVCLILLCFFLFGFNKMTQAHEKMKESYMQVANSSKSAYELIGSSENKIVIIRLPDAKELMHPIAFWLGNKIYNKDYALYYNPKDYAMHMNGINIEQYENNSNYEFIYFKNLHINNNVDVIFKNRNSFFKLGDDLSDIDIFNASIIPESNADSFDIYIPDFVFRSNKKIRIELEFVNQNIDISKILFGNYIVKKFLIDKNKISFETESYGVYNKLKFEFKRTNTQCNMHKIRVNYEKKSIYENAKGYSTNNLSKNAFTLISKYDCFFKIYDLNNSGLLVFGSLTQNKPCSSFMFTNFIDSTSLLEIEYWSSDLIFHNKLSNISLASKIPIRLLP